MRADLIELLECPACRVAAQLTLDEHRREGHEIVAGTLTCAGCGRDYRILAGIPELIYGVDDDTSRELDARRDARVDAAALASARRRGDSAESWALRRDRRVDCFVGPAGLDVSHAFAVSDFSGVLDNLQVGGRRILDLGAGTCWSTRVLAGLGADCVAVDLIRSFLELGQAHLDVAPFFDRVAANMNRLPFRNGLFDLVFSSATLHHTSDLGTTLSEVGRVLVPRGQFVLSGEPVAGALRNYQAVLQRDRDEGLNEHVYSLPEYLAAAREAGFTVKFVFPDSFRRQVRGQLPHPPTWRLRLARLIPEKLLEWALPLEQQLVGVSLCAVLTKTSP